MSIERVDYRPEVHGVAGRWKRQYCVNGEWSDCISGSGLTIYKALQRLPANATAENVAAIIGNDSWVGRRCVECKNQFVLGWRLGEIDDGYESATIYFCDGCAATISKQLSSIISEASGRRA